LASCPHAPEHHTAIAMLPPPTISSQLSTSAPPGQIEPQAPRARVIAFYLPQFHRIPENDAWWGEGFTEWTNVRRARPLFEGHEQPKRPAELGYYDLLSPEVRSAQARMAASHGIEGFCYWHYWFAGRRLLERPFEEVLRTGEPSLPFCLGWANESWTGSWRNEPYRIFLEQTYPGPKDNRAHFDFLLRAFRDPRYIKVDGKPLLYIYRPLKIPHSQALFETWRRWAMAEGMPGLFIVGKNMFDYRDPSSLGLDGCVVEPLGVRFSNSRYRDLATGLLWSVRNRLSWGGPRVIEYQEATKWLRPQFEDLGAECFPCAYPNWDNTPRVGKRGLVLNRSTPEAFGSHLEMAVQSVAMRPTDHRLVFLKSWNEWGEGNFLEPDLANSKSYLTMLKKVIVPSNMDPPKLA
jgi:hypothetical protein